MLQIIDPTTVFTRSPWSKCIYEMNERCQLFYAHDKVSSSGKKYIVSQMCGQQSNTQLDIYNQMTTV